MNNNYIPKGRLYIHYASEVTEDCKNIRNHPAHTQPEGACGISDDNGIFAWFSSEKEAEAECDRLGWKKKKKLIKPLIGDK